MSKVEIKQNGGGDCPLWYSRSVVFWNFVTPSASTSFVDCGEANIKMEIKEEETLDEDPISIKIEAESVEVIIKEEIKEEEGIESEEFV